MTDTHHDAGHGHAPSGEGGKVIPLPEARLVSKYTSGGHEIDAVPAKSLFGFLAVMTVLLLVTAAFVYQLFVGHADGDLKRAADQPASELVAQHAKEKALFESWGKVSRDNQVVGYHMPLETAKALVLTNKARFAPTPPPAGWVHPDDAPKN